MARRKAAEEEGGSWMDTYGDMVTLILTFFVLLFSMSTMEKSKVQYIAQAFSSQGKVVNEVVAGEEKVENPQGNLIEEAMLNGTGGAPETFEQLYQYLQEAVAAAGMGESVEVSMSASSVYLQFRDNVFFAPNSSILLDSGKEILDSIGPGIKDVESDILGLRVNGHTAEAAGSPVDDYALSGQRAIAVSQYLRDQGHLDASLISSAAFGKYHSIDTNETEEGRRRNRRVEIVIMNKNADLSDPAVIQDILTMEFGDGAVYPSNSADGVPPPAETQPGETAPPVDGEGAAGTADPAGTDGAADPNAGDTDGGDAGDTPGEAGNTPEGAGAGSNNDAAPGAGNDAGNAEGAGAAETAAPVVEAA